MNTKLKINLSEGLLEVEGSETFVNTIYEDFKGNLLQNKPSKAIERPSSEKPNTPKAVKGKPSVSTAKRRKTKSKSSSIVSGLDLRPKGQTSLDDFIAGLKVKSNLERNAAFLYYLIHEIKASDIGLDHIYTCYRYLKAKVPAAFYQSIVDTGLKGWIDTTKTEDLTLTGVGLNFVEHDMQSTD